MVLVSERARRLPLAYVRRKASFRGLDLAVDQRVFVPRPETELLVEAAALSVPVGSRVLEPCTGSGAIAVALSHERPDLDITASDTSRDAVDVRDEKCSETSSTRIRVVHADGIARVPGGPVDAVVCNPPYVAENERGADTLPPELEHHEPGQAFWAGSDGLDAFSPPHPRALRHGTRWVGFEVGDGQHETVASPVGQKWFPRATALANTRRDRPGCGRGTMTPYPRARDEETVITPCRDGPLLVRGNFRVVGQDGAAIITSRQTVALCRCGRSGMRPLCDGSHRTARFRATGGAEGRARRFDDEDS